MVRLRQVTTLLTASVACLALCGHVRAEAPVEITYSTFLDPDDTTDPRAAAQNAMIAAFEQANPGIKVKVVIDNAQSSFTRTLKTGTDGLDVGRVTSFSIPELINTGSLLDLDSYVARDKVSTTDWLLPLDQSKIGGHLWGLPQDYRIPILMYRKSLLEAAKLQPPQTWDEVCTAGGKLATPSVIGFALPLGNSGGAGGAQALGEYTLSSILAPDGQYFSADGREILFSKATFVRAAAMFKDLYGRCKATSQTSVQFGYNEIHDGLRADTVAMADFGLARFNAIKRQGAGDDLGWAPPPGFKPDDKQTVFGFQILINAHSKHVEESWKLVKFLTGTQAEAIAATGGEVVARASAYQEPYFATPEAANQKQWADLVRSRGQSVSYSVILATFHQIVGEALQRMVLRNGTPEAAYDEVTTKYAAAIARVH